MASPEQEKAARLVIDRIRKNNFLVDLDSAEDWVKGGVLYLQTQLNNSL